jgi:hypothetical protein
VLCGSLSGKDRATKEEKMAITPQTYEVYHLTAITTWLVTVNAPRSVPAITLAVGFPQTVVKDSLELLVSRGAVVQVAAGYMAVTG